MKHSVSGHSDGAPDGAVAQLAALCHRDSGKGTEVLLVTSSHRRWILPKGWPIAGKDSPDAAMQEAWEEAGVKAGAVDARAVGTFHTVKRYDSGEEVPCETTVYAIEVVKTSRDYPEADKRKRRWVSLSDAAGLVDEPGLRQLLRDF